MRVTRRSALMGMAALAAGGRLSAARADEPLTLWEAVFRTREARMKEDHAAWREWGLKAIDLAPEHVDFRVSVARASAALGKADEAYEHLAIAIRRGAGFDPAKVKEFAKLDIPGDRA